MKNLDNFTQAVKSPKGIDLMGYICPKNTFLQLKHHIQRIYETLLSAACVKIHQILYVIFEPQSHLSRHNSCVLFSSNISYFRQRQPIKVQSFRILIALVKFTKTLMSFMKPKVIFPSRLEPIFSIMTHYSSVLFLALFTFLALYTLVKRRPLKCKF